MFWEVFFANAVTRAVALGFALWVAGGVLARMADRMLAAACGFLLAAALGHLIPEAFESAAPGSAGALVATMIGAALFFLLFSRLTASAHVHGRLGEAHAIEPAPLLAGGMLHGFADGVLVAASFLADERTGWLIALAVLFHEFPQQVGYLTVLRSAGMSRRRSAVFCTVIAFSAVAGGMAGCIAIGMAGEALPYALAASGASFVYITLASLLPEAFRTARTGRDRRRQLAALLLGAAAALAILGLEHHGHDGHAVPHEEIHALR